MRKAKIIIVIFLWQLPLHAFWGGGNWLSIQERLQNTVMQVVAQVGYFNWIEPYKTRQQGESRGSGFFINQKGDLITNFHVVDQAKRVWVHLPAFGKKRLHAQVIGVSPDRDLALLRLNPEETIRLTLALGSIPYISFGDADAVKRTDKVLVLGYPLGYHLLKSATGIVSGRAFVGGQSYIQVTAPINLGNSGGPLLNAKGEVIGINTAAVPSAENVGYSIPVHELQIVLDDLYNISLLRRPLLGIQFNNGSDELAKLLNNPPEGGVYIGKVFKDSLAEKVGVKPGDVLYKLNDYAIDEFGEAAVPWSQDRMPIQDLVARLKLGEKVVLVVYRNGERKELTFAFEQTTMYSVRTMYADYEKIDYEVIGGMVITQLVGNHLLKLAKRMPYLIKYTKMENRVDPVLVVTNILPGSYAKQMNNINPGDVIYDVNGVRVRTLDDFRNALQKSLKNDFMTVKTEEDVFMVFPFKKIVEDEVRLSRDFGYPVTDTVRGFLERVSKDQ